MLTTMENKIFDLLDTWKSLPSYQLERRADIFFAIYLPHIIKIKFKKEVCIIIPEFPVRIGTIYPDIPINKSYKIDYVVTTNDNTAFIIELKTNDNSTRDSQNSYLQKSLEVGYKSLIDGIITIYEATDYKQKYDNLIRLLEYNNSISVSNGEMKPTDNIKFYQNIIFIKPNKKSDDIGLVIDFKNVVEIIQSKYNDSFSKRFCESLIKWKEF